MAVESSVIAQNSPYEIPGFYCANFGYKNIRMYMVCAGLTEINEAIDTPYYMYIAD